MRRRNIAWLAVVPVALIVLFIPVNVQVFAFETDSPLPPIDTLVLNGIIVKNFQIDNFTSIYEGNSIKAGQATLSMSVKNLSNTYRIDFEVSAKNVTVIYSNGTYHFDNLILRGYADLNEKTVKVEAYEPIRIMDLLRRF